MSMLAVDKKEKNGSACVPISSFESTLFTLTPSGEETFMLMAPDDARETERRESKAQRKRKKNDARSSTSKTTAERAKVIFSSFFLNPVSLVVSLSFFSK